MNPGIYIVLSSVTIYSLLPVLLKKSSSVFPPFTIIWISMFFLFLSSLLLSFSLEKNSLPKITQHPQIIFILILVGLLNAFGFWLAIQGYKYMPLWQQTMFQVLVPILSAIFAYFILGEAISPKLFIGLSIMVIGLYIAMR